MGIASHSRIVAKMRSVMKTEYSMLDQLVFCLYPGR